MSKALYAKNNGDIMIWDKLAGDNPDVIIGSPASFMDRMKFHSDFNYLKAKYAFKTTISEPVYSSTETAPRKNTYTLYSGPIGSRLWLMMDAWGGLAASVYGYHTVEPAPGFLQQYLYVRRVGESIILEVNSSSITAFGYPAWTHTFSGLVMDSI